MEGSHPRGAIEGTMNFPDYGHIYEGGNGFLAVAVYTGKQEPDGGGGTTNNIVRVVCWENYNCNNRIYYAVRRSCTPKFSYS